MSAPERLKALNCAPARRAALLIPLSLFMAGCSTPPRRASQPPPPPPQNRVARTQESPPAPQPPPAHTNVMLPTPQPALIVKKPEPPPRAPNRGSEGLLSLTRPMTVRARERTAPAAEPSAPPSSKPESSATSSDTPTQALIVQGPPPQPAPASRLAGKTKALLWFGSLVSVGALAVVLRLYLLRKTLPPGMKANADLKMPREMGFKEPISAP